MEGHKKRRRNAMTPIDNSDNTTKHDDLSDVSDVFEKRLTKLLHDSIDTETLTAVDTFISTATARKAHPLTICMDSIQIVNEAIQYSENVLQWRKEEEALEYLAYLTDFEEPYTNLHKKQKSSEENHIRSEQNDDDDDDDDDET
jgi:hypothetical protein